MRATEALLERKLAPARVPGVSRKHFPGCRERRGRSNIIVRACDGREPIPFYERKLTQRLERLNEDRHHPPSVFKPTRAGIRAQISWSPNALFESSSPLHADPSEFKLDGVSGVRFNNGEPRNFLCAGTSTEQQREGTLSGERAKSPPTKAVCSNANGTLGPSYHP